MAKPTLNDQYWFDLSKTMVDSGHDRRDQYAEKLQKLVLWMWGIYTAATGVGFALADKRLSLLTTCIVAAASGLLIVVYWCTFWCMAPGIAGGFDPRSPDDIRDTYSTAMRVKDTRIRWTLAISVVAAVGVSFAIILASMPTDAVSEGSLSATFEGTPKDGQVLVAAACPGAEKVSVVVEEVSAEGTRWPVVTRSFLTTSGGQIQTNVPVQLDHTQLRVSVVWTQDGLERRLTRTVGAG